MDKLLLIDGHNLLFRMFYGIPANIKNSKGEEIKGLIGFVGSILKLLKKFETNRVIVVFDGEKGISLKKRVLNDYKSNRTNFIKSDTDEVNPFYQLPKIKRALKFMGIQYIEMIDSEGDDIIATLCKKYKSIDKIIVSMDKDFFQLINQDTCVFFPRGKLSVLYDEDTFINRYGIIPKKFIDYKALVGDPSDNLSGIKGIGTKTAIKILEYNCVEEFIENNKESRIVKLIDFEILNKYRAIIKLDGSIEVNIELNEINFNIVNMRTMDILQSIGER